MTVNFKNVFRIIGFMMLGLGISLLPPLAVSFIYREPRASVAFILTIVLCLAAGFVLLRIFRPSEKKLKAREGFLIVALSWLLASAIGALPFVISGAIPSYIDAFFETCSGFSTTGSSILTDIESLPKSILFWRSFTHWMGGMGIIVLLMSFLPSLGASGQLIASAETPGPVLDKVTPRFSDTARKLYTCYIIITVLEIVLLLAGGMSVYDALVHTFGTVGTGGFSSYGDSIAHFDSSYIHWVITIFMLLCGINFNLYFVLIRRGPVKMLKDPELRLYLFIIGITALLIFADLMAKNVYDNAAICMRDSAFQVVSIITTTGFVTADFDLWPTLSKMLIFMLMLTGACSSSTGGGVKIIRILTVSKLIKRGLSKKIHPSRVVSITSGGKEVPQEVTTNMANFVFFYIFLIFAGSLLISFNGFDLTTTISSVVTCLGNIGPGFNLVGPTMNFSLFSGFSKFILSILMIAGRLELFTLFMLFSPHFWNSNKS